MAAWRSGFSKVFLPSLREGGRRLVSIRMNPATRYLLARALLVTHEIGVPAHNAAVRACGPEYAQNSSIAVLGTLAFGGSTRPRDLCRSTRLTSGGLSNLLSRLERDGLIERSERDGRAVFVSLTAAGHTMESEVSGAIAQALSSCSASIKNLIVLLVQAGAKPADIELLIGTMDNTKMGLAIARTGVKLSEALKAVQLVGGVAGALALAVLETVGDSRPRSISNLIGISSGGVSRLLDRLEEASLVERRPDVIEADHRGVVISITPEGQEQLESALQRAQVYFDELLGIIRSISRYLETEVRESRA